MKKFLMLIFVSIISVSIYGQSEKKNYLGGHLSYGDVNFIRNLMSGFSSKEYVGTTYFGIGLDYSHRSSENAEICVGFHITGNKMQRTSSFYSNNGSNTSTLGDQLYIFSIPVHLKYHFLKYLFVDGGPCFNIHPAMGYKWGIGFGLGIGAEYEFKSGLTLSFSPYGQWNWLNIGDTGDTMGGGIDRLSQLGVKIGIGCRF